MFCNSIPSQTKGDLIFSNLHNTNKQSKDSNERILVLKRTINLKQLSLSRHLKSSDGFNRFQTNDLCSADAMPMQCRCNADAMPMQCDAMPMLWVQINPAEAARIFQMSIRVNSLNHPCEWEDHFICPWPPFQYTFLSQSKEQDHNI